MHYRMFLCNFPEEVRKAEKIKEDIDVGPMLLGCRAMNH